MLNSEYIHSKISAPSKCGSDDTGKLNELSILFPYASSFSVLYLKALSNSGDIRLESELEKVAFKISDRGVLYNILHPKNEVISENRIAEVDSKETELSPEVINLATLSVGEDEKLVNDCQTEEKAFFESKVSDFELNEEGEVPEVATLDKEELEICETFEEKSEDLVTDAQHVFESTMDDELDKIIVSAAISNAFVTQELTQLDSESTFTDFENESIDVARTNIATVDQSEEVVILNPEKTEKETKEETTKEIVAPKSFTAWLKINQSKHDDTDEFADISKKTEYYTFEKPKKEFFSPVKKAKESLDENKMPVSETLAKIFALQGNYSKAIYVYEQLTLLFPEKKSFFASQIRNLKKKINS